MKTDIHIKGFEKGVVSLFTVLFTTLLLTVITVSFLRIMVQEQQQAQNQDLSQSAYDSAVSGVEDAKRVLRLCYQQGPSSQACAAINSRTCDTISSSGVVSGSAGQETVIRGDSGETRMNQAYTCVKVIRDTYDYVGDITTAGSSIIVPLRATNTFNKIVIEWMDRSGQYSDAAMSTLMPPLNPDDQKSLPPEASWNESSPAVLRALTVLPPNANKVTNAELDTDVASTVFLRPWVPSTEPSPFGQDIDMTLVNRTAKGGTGNSAVQQVACSKVRYEVDMTYACKATLIMPAGKSVPASSEVAFMRLTSLYNPTSFKVTLFDGNNPVTFDGVQPEVDSTGRAGTILRRIVSKVSGEFLPPYDVEAALNTTFDLCKDFYITDVEEDAGSGGSTCGS